MKPTVLLSLAIALSGSSLALAQPGGMMGKDMKEMDMKGMQGMDNKQQDGKAMTHQATGVVKKVDAANGKVTLSHEPVKSLNWPAMTMGFSVKDKTLLDKLAVGKKVNVEFVQQGADYVVTAVK